MDYAQTNRLTAAGKDYPDVYIKKSVGYIISAGFGGGGGGGSGGNRTGRGAPRSKGNKTIKFGSDVKSKTKIKSQMSKRGWTKDSIQDTVDNSFTTRASKNLATKNSATVYYNKDGSYVILDDVTNELVQISDRNDIGWIPDSNIQNPFKP